MKIQAYLTAAAINLKRLAAAIVALPWLAAAVLFDLPACSGRAQQDGLVDVPV